MRLESLLLTHYVSLCLMEKVRLTRGKVCHPNKQKSDRNTLESIPDWILNTHVRAHSFLRSVLS